MTVPDPPPPPPTHVPPIEKQPAVRLMPFARLDEAVELERIEPPESKMPLEEARPAVWRPPEKVEVADEVMRSEPPVRVMPPEDPSEAAVRPPVKDDVAAPVTLMSGVMTLEVAKSPETEVVPEIKALPWTAKRKSPPMEVVPAPVWAPASVPRYVVPVAVRVARLVCPEMLAVPFTDKLWAGVEDPRPTDPKRAVYGKAEMPPPVRVKPPAEEIEAAAKPPERVEVAVEVISNEPPETERPVEALSEVRARPPEKVEVAVEVFVTEPPEIARPPVTPSCEAVMPPVKLEVAAPVTLMSGVMTDEVAKRPETEVVPEMRASPCTDKVWAGVAVAMPKRVAALSQLRPVASSTVVPAPGPG